MGRMMGRAIDALDWVSRRVAQATMMAVVLAAGAMMAALILQVFSRYVLGATFVWTEELALLLFTWIVLLGASIGIREGTHVRLGLLVDALPALPRSVWQRLVAALVLAFCLILLSSGMDYPARTSGRFSAAIRYPIEWMHAGTQVFTLIAIPGLILSGDLMMRGGLSRRLVAVCQALVRHVTGGLGMVTDLSATFFAAISGSAPATTAAIGGIMIPEMERAGYRKRFAAVLATAAGPIGQMIPPSIPMVIWGVVAEQSIGQLFLAGIVPGLMIAAGLMVVWWFAARAEGVVPETRRATSGELVAAVNEG